MGGIPGTGKTKVGDYFSTKLKYTHLDFDRCNVSHWPSVFCKVVIRCLPLLGPNIIVTWGFQPTNNDIVAVNLFKKIGFQIIWFDGNREQARKEFVRREKEAHTPRSEEALVKLFDEKIKKIDSENVVTRIIPIEYNTFTDAGKFKDLNQIVEEILCL